MTRPADAPPDPWREILVCPACRGDLVDHAEGLVCPACRRLYPVVDGVPWMLEERSRPVPRD